MYTNKKYNSCKRLNLAMVVRLSQHVQRTITRDSDFSYFFYSTIFLVLTAQSTLQR
jgi:hypothetical protein